LLQDGGEREEGLGTLFMGAARRAGAGETENNIILLRIRCWPGIKQCFGEDGPYCEMIIAARLLS